MSASLTRTELHSGAPRLVWCGAEGGVPPSALPAAGEIHLWPFRIAHESGSDCLPLLSPDERERALRLFSLPARHQAIVARGKLRWLLGGYLRRDPARLVFRTEPHGKPRLAGDGEGLQFNVSHSRDVLLIGVSIGGALGVDVEHLRPLDNLDGLMRVALTPAEQDEVQAQHGTLPRLSRFFQLWTRKEAYLKATGEGIVAGFARRNVAATPGWHTRDIALGPGVIGAVVAEDVRYA